MGIQCQSRFLSGYLSCLNLSGHLNIYQPSTVLDLTWDPLRADHMISYGRIYNSFLFSIKWSYSKYVFIDFLLEVFLPKYIAAGGFLSRFYLTQNLVGSLLSLSRRFELRFKIQKKRIPNYIVVRVGSMMGVYRICTTHMPYVQQHDPLYVTSTHIWALVQQSNRFDW